MTRAVNARSFKRIEKLCESEREKRGPALRRPPTIQRSRGRIPSSPPLIQDLSRPDSTSTDVDLSRTCPFLGQPRLHPRAEKIGSYQLLRSPNPRASGRSLSTPRESRREVRPVQAECAADRADQQNAKNRRCRSEGLPFDYNSASLWKEGTGRSGPRRTGGRMFQESGDRKHLLRRLTS